MFVWFRYRRVDVNTSAVVGRLGLGHVEERDEEPPHDRVGREAAYDVCDDGARAD